MRLSYIALLSTALAWPISEKLSGCSQPLPVGQQPGSTTNVTISSNGIQRSYLIFVPPTYQPGCPASLILSYHGGNQNAGQQLELDGLTLPYFNNDSFVIYPQGIKDTWEGVPGVTTNDTAFTTAILDSVQRQYCIRLDKIYATGKSDGGGFVNLMACHPTLSTRIAAFAPVSGAYYIDTLPCDPDTVAIPCDPGRTDVPMMAFHGGADNIINYNGGERKHECLPSITHWINEWASRDELGTENRTTAFAKDAVLYQFGESHHRTAGLVELVYDSVNGHDWPSTQPNLDNTHLPPFHSVSFNATSMILDFFGKHSLPERWMALSWL